LANLGEELQRLEPLAGETGFQREWQTVKADNKRALARVIKERTDILVDPHSLFDIQVKRLHEYKRQHLNVLYLVTLYNRLRRASGATATPRTVIFGGKAAPGYRMAKLIIKLINSVAGTINQDPLVSQVLKVVFLPDFNVKNSQRIYPAADLSEQTSTAGKEASGTGNMKFAMNGAITIGTLDGANIEIRDAVGQGNFFLFGLTAEQVERRWAEGYAPRSIYESNPELREAIDLQFRLFLGRRSRTLSPARRVAAHSRRLHAPGGLSGLCGMPRARQRSVLRPVRLDADVHSQLRAGRAVLVRPFDPGVLSRHLESCADRS
jgi:starch phosphorylase